VDVGASYRVIDEKILIWFSGSLDGNTINNDNMIVKITDAFSGKVTFIPSDSYKMTMSNYTSAIWLEFKPESLPKEIYRGRVEIQKAPNFNGLIFYNKIAAVAAERTIAVDNFFNLQIQHIINWAAHTIRIVSIVISLVTKYFLIEYFPIQISTVSHSAATLFSMIDDAISFQLILTLIATPFHPIRSLLQAYLSLPILTALNLFGPLSLESSLDYAASTPCDLPQGYDSLPIHCSLISNLIPVFVSVGLLFLVVLIGVAGFRRYQGKVEQPNSPSVLLERKPPTPLMRCGNIFEIWFQGSRVWIGAIIAIGVGANSGISGYRVAGKILALIIFILSLYLLHREVTIKTKQDEDSNTNEEHKAVKETKDENSDLPPVDSNFKTELLDVAKYVKNKLKCGWFLKILKDFFSVAFISIAIYSNISQIILITLLEATYLISILTLKPKDLADQRIYIIVSTIARIIATASILPASLLNSGDMLAALPSMVLSVLCLMVSCGFCGYFLFKVIKSKGKKVACLSSPEFSSIAPSVRVQLDSKMKMGSKLSPLNGKSSSKSPNGSVLTKNQDLSSIEMPFCAGDRGSLSPGFKKECPVIEEENQQVIQPNPLLVIPRTPKGLVPSSPFSPRKSPFRNLNSPLATYKIRKTSTSSMIGQDI